VTKRLIQKPFFLAAVRELSLGDGAKRSLEITRGALRLDDSLGRKTTHELVVTGLDDPDRLSGCFLRGGRIAGSPLVSGDIDQEIDLVIFIFHPVGDLNGLPERLERTPAITGFSLVAGNPGHDVRLIAPGLIANRISQINRLPPRFTGCVEVSSPGLCLAQHGHAVDAVLLVLDPLQSLQCLAEELACGVR
jgi:hypothetical protein